MRKFFAFMAAFAVCITVSSCGDKNTLHEDNSATEQYIAELSETLRTEETTVTTTLKDVTETTEKAETEPPSPLEEMKTWATGGSDFLYDITGDGFPELLKVYFAEDAIFIEAVSEIYEWDDYIETDGKVYVCRGGDGRIFLASCSGNFFNAGVTEYTALRYDFYSNDIEKTCIANVDVYMYPYWETDDDTYLYCTYDSDVFENCSVTLDSHTAENMLAEYISAYELLDVIEIINDNGEISVSFGADGDFSEECSDDLPENELRSEEIMIGNEIYSGDISNIVFRPKQLGGDFDFDILNRFENLTDIDFVCDHAYSEKTVIKTGEWCKKIKSLQVDVSAYDTVNTDFSAFENVEYININGHGTRGNLEFLKDMPNIKLIYAFFLADSAEAFIPFTELPKLEAVIDSGQGSCTENLSEEEREKVTEFFPRDKYFWGVVK